jgi:polyhydroxybutyrate depolymerase
VATVINVDSRRVYATGFSNGGFMCYQLAGQIPDRIAAIAPVSGAMVADQPPPQRPVPVIHFHGTADRFVRYEGPGHTIPRLVRFRAVEDTVQLWAQAAGCAQAPTVTDLPRTPVDATSVRRTHYGPGAGGAEVVLYSIIGGGHTWPGRQPRMTWLLGKSTRQISANDLMWEFFQRHPRG